MDPPLPPTPELKARPPIYPSMRCSQQGAVTATADLPSFFFSFSRPDLGCWPTFSTALELSRLCVPHPERGAHVILHHRLQHC